MSEPIEPEKDRLGLKKENKELRDRVTELERVAKALVIGMREIEDEIGAMMPEGDYFGEKF